jgi:hypothetical protein
MSKAFVCDLTGKLCKGQGLRHVNVDVNPELRVTVAIQRRTDKDSFEPGEVSEEGAHIIEAAVMTLAAEQQAKRAKPGAKPKSK